MSRKPSTACTRCPQLGVRATMRKDGDGYRHHPSCPGTPTAPPATVKIKGSPPPPPSFPTAEGLNAQASAVTKKNRKGAIDRERARECKHCHCTAEAPCDKGAGVTCSWMSSSTPKDGDVCTACGELIESAKENLEDIALETLDAQGLAFQVYEGAEMPCLGSFDEARARLGSVIAFAIATTKKMSSPAAPVDERQIDWTKPTGAKPSAAEKKAAAEQRRQQWESEPARGSCPDCNSPLGRPNSSRLSDGSVVHVGCPASDPDVALGVPCPPPTAQGGGGCGAAVGEPCTWTLPEPRSWVHPHRLELLPTPASMHAWTRGIKDQIRSLIDYYANRASVHPLPTERVIVRALTEQSAAISEEQVLQFVRDMFVAGELTLITEGVKEPYYRRVEGSAPVVMGPGKATEPPERQGDCALSDGTVCGLSSETGPLCSRCAGATGLPDEDIVAEASRAGETASVQKSEELEQAIDELGDRLSDVVEAAKVVIDRARSQTPDTTEAKRLSEVVDNLTEDLADERAKLRGVGQLLDAEKAEHESTRAELASVKKELAELRGRVERQRQAALAALSEAA